MSTLRQAISTLAADFAESVLTAIRGASLSDLVAPGGARARGRPSASSSGGDEGQTRRRRGRGGRRRRRSQAEIDRVMTRVTELLTRHPEGLRSEQIRAALGLDKQDIGRPIVEALARGLLRKTGDRRTTTYFVGRGGRSGGTAKRGASRGAGGKRRGKRGGKRSSKRGARKGGKRRAKTGAQSSTASEAAATG